MVEFLASKKPKCRFYEAFLVRETAILLGCGIFQGTISRTVPSLKEIKRLRFLSHKSMMEKYILAYMQTWILSYYVIDFQI